MSDVRRDGSVKPMSSGAGTEWFPAAGVSWQVLQVPLIVATARSSFSPFTPAIAMAFVLNSAWPGATARRAASVPLPGRLIQASDGRG